MKVYKSKNIEETNKIALNFISFVKPLKNEAKVVGLYGDLGAGKTAFVKGVAHALGLAETVTSPTFIIEKIYSLQYSKTNVFKKLIHIDAYRLNGGEDLLTLNWEEICSDPHNIIFIEWPEKVQNVLPQAIQNIYFEFVDDSTRKIRF